MHLYDCLLSNQDCEIRLEPEGPCAVTLGLYDILDDFCLRTGYQKNRISLLTANMVEMHPEYSIKKIYDYWYEIDVIQEWAKSWTGAIKNSPAYHFGCFVGRSRWPRLWISTWLWSHHRAKTFQTFHSGPQCHYRTEASDGIYDWLGLEDLINHDCDFMDDVIKFLGHCPMVIDHDMQVVKNTKIMFEQVGHYPLQHPANLNIVHEYQNIFVDIICEPNVSGNCFLSTEKLWRCIVARRPFILVGCAEHLTNLRRLGFRTWHDWWSEDYDGQSNETRLKMIQSVLDQLAEWNHEQINETLQYMQLNLEHNYQVFMELEKADFQKVFDAR